MAAIVPLLSLPSGLIPSSAAGSIPKYTLTDPAVLAEECGVHLILENASDSHPLSVSMKDSEEFDRFCRTPFTVPINPDFDFRQLGIPPDQLHDFIPPIQLVPMDVFHVVTQRLRHENVATLPPLLYGGAVRHLFTQKPLKDLDPITFLQRNELQTPLHIFIDIIIGALRLTKHRLNLEGKNIRALIKNLYFFNCHLEPRVVSCINLGVINWKFIAPNSMQNDFRFHLTSADRIFMDFFGRQLYYYNRQKTCAANEYQTSLDDLRLGIFREDQPATIRGLAGRRLYADLCGLNVLDHAEVEAQKKFLIEFESADSLTYKLQTHFHYKFASDPHGAFLILIKYLKFIAFISDEVKREDYWRACARAWLKKPNRSVEFSTDIISDFRSLIKPCEEAKAEMHSPTSCEVIPARAQQLYFSLASLILDHPQLTLQIVDLITGVFLYQWLRTNSSIHFEASSKWQLCWSRGCYPYYLSMPTCEIAFCSTFKAWKNLLAYRMNIQDLFHDLGFSDMDFSEKGLQNFTSFFLNALNFSSGIALVRQRFLHSPAIEEVLSLRDELASYYSATQLDKWHVQALLIKESNSNRSLFPQFAELLTLLGKNLAQFNPILLTKLIQQFHHFFAISTLHSQISKSCKALLHRSWLILIDQSAPISYEISNFKLFQDLCLLPIAESTSGSTEIVSNKLAAAYQEAICHGDFLEVTYLYTRLRKQLPHRASEEPLRVQIEILSKEFPRTCHLISRVLSLMLQFLYRQVFKNFEEGQKGLNHENEKLYLYFIHEAALFLNSAESQDLIQRMLSCLLMLPPRSNPWDTAEMVTYARETLSNGPGLSVDPMLFESHIHSLLNLHLQSPVIRESGLEVGLFILSSMRSANNVHINRLFNLIISTLLRLEYNSYSRDLIARCLKIRLKSHALLIEEERDYLHQMQSLNTTGNNYLKLLEKFCLLNKKIPQYVFDFLNLLINHLEAVEFMELTLNFIEALLKVKEQSSTHLDIIVTAWESLPAADNLRYFKVGCYLAKTLAKYYPDILPQVIVLIKSRFKSSYSYGLIEELIGELNAHKQDQHAKSLKNLLPHTSPAKALAPMPTKSEVAPSPLTLTHPLSSSSSVKQNGEVEMDQQCQSFLSELRRKQNPEEDFSEAFINQFIENMQNILSHSVFYMRYEEKLRISIRLVFQQQASKISIKKLEEILDVFIRTDKLDLCHNLWLSLSETQQTNSKIAFKMIHFTLVTSEDPKTVMRLYWDAFKASKPRQHTIQEKADQLISKCVKSPRFSLLEFTQTVFIESKGGLSPRTNALLIATTFSKYPETEGFVNQGGLLPFLNSLFALRLISIQSGESREIDLPMIIAKLKNSSEIEEDEKERQLSKKKIYSLSLPKNPVKNCTCKRRALVETGVLLGDYMGRCLTTHHIRDLTSFSNRPTCGNRNITKVAILGIVGGVALMIAMSIFKRRGSSHIKNIVLCTLALVVVSIAAEALASYATPGSNRLDQALEVLSLVTYAAIAPHDEDRVIGFITSLAYLNLWNPQSK